MITSLMLALALATNGHKSMDITEQQLTTYVNEKVKYEQKYSMPGLFDANIKLNNMKVALGRQVADQAAVTGLGTYTLTLPNKPAINGTMEAHFQAKPRYEPKDGAIYLDNFQLQEYKLEPQSVQQQFGPMLDFLVQRLQQKLAKEPAYRLNTANQDQAWLKEHVTGVVIKPGVLHLTTQ